MKNLPSTGEIARVILVFGAVIVICWCTGWVSTDFLIISAMFIGAHTVVSAVVFVGIYMLCRSERMPKFVQANPERFTVALASVFFGILPLIMAVFVELTHFFNIGNTGGHGEDMMTVGIFAVWLVPLSFALAWFAGEFKRKCMWMNLASLIASLLFGAWIG